MLNHGWKNKRGYSMLKLQQVKLFHLIFILINCIAFLPSTGYSEPFDKLPVKGMVTMIDLGAKKCIPCKMMAPILEKLEKLYKEKAVIVFIDVWENRAQAKKYNIRSIPTQIFFDKQMKEIYRHVGFMSEEEIKAQLKKMGIDPPKETKS